MIGDEAIAGFAIGDSTDSTVVYEPVSRITNGGAANTRPTTLAFLGIEIMYDSEDVIAYDSGDSIAWG